MSNPLDDADATLRSWGFEWKVEFNITVTEAKGSRPEDSKGDWKGSYVFNFIGMYFPTKYNKAFLGTK